MKKINKILVAIFSLLMILTSCNDGIDPITSVNPGIDKSAPVVNIKYPLEGTKIKVREDVVSIKIDLEVTDDIEIDAIKVVLDNEEIATLNNFKDYRRVLKEVIYDHLETGEHELKVIAIDLEQKETIEVVNFEKEAAYVPLYPNEILYMPFDGDYTELISITSATKVGSPNFAGESVVGTNAYVGAQDAYLTFPTKDLSLGTELSATFWYKVNPNPDRAGILVIGPPDTDNPDAMNNRKSGFRFFRENADGKQRVKLNVGNGTADAWVDGGAAADIDPTNDQWEHIAFTISATEAVVYINGNVVKRETITGVDWTGCDILSIMSGAPRFSEWGHKSDSSFLDDLRLYNKALSEAEVQETM